MEFGGDEGGNSGLKANFISTSTVITSPNYHNSPAYLMRLIMWACLLSISRGYVASVGTYAILLRLTLVLKHTAIETHDTSPTLP